MKKFLILTILLCAVSGNAYAIGPYISVKGTYSSIRLQQKWKDGAIPVDTNHEKDSVWSPSVAVGAIERYRYANLRAELEYNKYGKLEYKDGKGWDNEISQFSMMFNVYVDFNLGTITSPYFGAGFGYSHMKHDVLSRGENVSEGVIGWQLMAGLGFNISRYFTIDVGYRYVDFGRFKNEFKDMGFKDSVKLTSHEFLIGGRLGF